MNINENGLYCAYLRKSRRDEEMEALGQGETLQRHEKQLQALYNEYGISRKKLSSIRSYLLTTPESEVNKGLEEPKLPERKRFGRLSK